MSEKLSQVTEDVLSSSDGDDHTLASMTSDTQSSTAGPNKNGSKSGNKSIMIGAIVCGVVVVVAVAGYYTFLRPTNVVKAKAVNRKPVEKVEAPAPSLPPVTQTENAVVPVAPIMPENNGFPQDMSKEGKVAADFLGVNNPSQLDVINQAGNEVVPLAPVVVPTIPVEVPVAPVMAPVEATSVVVPVIPTVPVIVAPPQKIEDTSLNSAFDSVARRVDDVSTKVDGLEKFKLAQEGLNENMVKRIVRLEGFHEGDANTVKKAVNSNVNTSGVVHKPRPVYKPRPKPVAKPAVSKSENDGDVLVDKSNVKSAVVENQKAKAVSNRLEEYQFHSIYDGRVWVKNSDGSLTTFAEGERLPSGEVIKTIDHKAFKVVTDKRTIIRR